MYGCTVTGTLKGYDALMNLVLDEVQETLRGMRRQAPFLPPSPPPPDRTSSRMLIINLIMGVDEEGNTSTRSLGLAVARGTLLVVISPVDGSEEIANPFLQQEAED